MNKAERSAFGLGMWMAKNAPPEMLECFQTIIDGADELLAIVQKQDEEIQRLRKKLGDDSNVTVFRIDGK